MCTFSFITLGRLRDKTGATGYSDIFSYIYSSRIALAVDINVAISAFAIVCCYTIVIGSVLPQVLSTWAGVPVFGMVSWSEQWIPGLWIVAVFILFPISSLKDLNSIRHLSMVGIVGIFWIVMGAGILLSMSDGTEFDCYIAPSAGPNTTSPLLVFAALPILGGICDAHMNAPRFAYEYRPILKANSGKYSFQFAAIVAMTIVICISLLFGFIGIFHVGMTVEGNILMSYPKVDSGAPKSVTTLVSTMWFMGVISVAISFVLFFNALRASVEKLAFREGTFMARRYPDTALRRISLTAVLVVLSTVVGSLVGKLGSFQACLWGFSGSLIVYILPMLAGLKLKIFDTKAQYYFAHVVLGFGVLFSMLLGTPMAAMDWAGKLPKVTCAGAA